MAHLDVDERGILDLDSLREVLESGVGLVSVMAANTRRASSSRSVRSMRFAIPMGPIFTWMPPRRLPLALRCLKTGICSHCRVTKPGIKGCRCLQLGERECPLNPSSLEETKNGSCRAGTVDVGPIVALAEAVTHLRLTASLRDQLERFVESIGGVVSAKDAPRLPNTLHVRLGSSRRCLVMGLDLNGVHIHRFGLCFRSVEVQSCTGGDGL